MTQGPDSQELGPLPPNWTWTTVERVGSVRVGRSLSPDKLTGSSPTKYIRAANITNRGLNLNDVLEMDFDEVEREIFALMSGDIVLAEASGSATKVGRAALWQGEIPGCCFQNTVIRFRPHATTPKFALFVFRHYSESGLFGGFSQGIGIQHLSAIRFSKIPFPLPPLAEQERIAVEGERRLQSIEYAQADLSQALRRITEQIKETLAAACSGKLIKQEAIDTTSRSAPSPELFLQLINENNNRNQDITRASLEAFHTANSTSIGQLPSGWLWVRTREAGTIQLGKQRAPERGQGGIPTPYLRVANVQEDNIDFDDLRLMNFSPGEREKFKLLRNDIILNVGQSPELVGRPALVRQEPPLLGFQNHLARFRPSSFVLPEYALVVFRHYLHAGVFRSLAKWSTNLATLSMSTLAGMPFPLPPLSEQKQIVAETTRRFKEVVTQEDSVRSALSALDEQRREIFSAAIKGQLVPHILTEEPAAKLLERLGPPLIGIPLNKPSRRKKGDRMGNRSSRTVGLQRRPLRETLLDANRPLSLPELIAQAGYDRDSVEDIERFYLALRMELGKSIRAVGNHKENALLEAIPNAPT